MAKLEISQQAIDKALQAALHRIFGAETGSVLHWINETAKAHSWTTEPPTQGGYYWAYDGDEVIFVEIYAETYDGTFRKPDGSVSVNWNFIACAHANVGEEWRALSEFTHWIGPLPRPEPPRL